jgi:hypothetical protein
MCKKLRMSSIESVLTGVGQMIAFLFIVILIISYLLENLANISKTIEPFMTLFQVGGSLAFGSAVGLLPRLGPGRAFTIALRSYLFPWKPTESFRPAEIQRIKNYINDTMSDTRYLVITGQKLIGKSCLIEYALKRTPGVIKMKVGQGLTSDE